MKRDEIPGVGGLPILLAYHVNRVCDGLEAAWRAGRRPRIEDVVALEAEPGRSVLLRELLAVELAARRRAGEVPDRREYLDRFPDESVVIDAVFDPAATCYSPRSVAAPIASNGPDTARPDGPPDGSLPAEPAESIDSASGPRFRDPRGGHETLVASPAALELPEDTGRYRVLGEIGHGGMGAVLRALDPALGRDLALKVLLKRHNSDPRVTGRFVEEARIGGQLQHPGIVPVYELGTFGDGRPYFTMKLVEGRTLAALLAERDTPAHDLPRFLGTFEQVCQTMAYAHARGVIHRDLKPSNIMVGSFGEVQVMDWGLAKVLARGGTDAESRAAGPALGAIRAKRSGPEEHASRVGDVMGTPAYMAPEQAGGVVEAVDERADVFSLGSILCEILSGAPAYTGPSSQAILGQASRGETAEALRRLDGCGADAELVALAKECLAAEPGARPRDAGAVARRITAHLAGVQERLQATELARAAEEARADAARATAAAAEGRARAERRARRMTAGLAASIVAAGALGAVGWTWIERDRMARRALVSARVAAALQETMRLRGQAQQSAVGDVAPWNEALAAARKAGELLEASHDPALLGQVEALLALVSRERDAAEAAAQAALSDRRLLDKLIDIRSAQADDRDGLTGDADYGRAFREAGIDADGRPPAETAVRIRARSTAVAAALVAALDDWAAVRRSRRQDEPGARRLAATANAADPDPWRVGLRKALDQSDRSSRAGALRDLAKATRPETAEAVDLDQLATALSGVGESSSAEDLLRAGRRRFPGDVWLNYDLARLLEASSRSEEAIRYYSVARAVRPETAHELAHALERKGESDEARAIFSDLVRLRPVDGRHWRCYGRLLQERGDHSGANEALEKAVAALRETIRVQPDHPTAHTNLGAALYDQGRMAEATTEFRTAIRLRPGRAPAHFNLGNALQAQRQVDEAIDAYRTAIRLRSDYASAHNNLGNALRAKGQLPEAIAAFRTAIRQRPNFVAAHFNLANALRAQGQLEEVIAAFRAVIQLEPNHAEAHCNLGHALKAQRKFAEALAELRTGHELGSKRPGWHYASAQWVRDAEQAGALAARLPAVLSGDNLPKDAAELLSFARFCHDTGRPAAASRLFAAAFEADPGLADDRQTQHRYDAAAAAALAGCGRGRDEPALGEAERAALRTRARGWLKAELAAWSKLLDAGSTQAGTVIVQNLDEWKLDPDLAGIRDEAELQKLAEDERRACRVLWSEVDALLARSRIVASP
jgi:serine/threonine-protein kinase